LYTNKMHALLLLVPALGFNVASTPAVWRQPKWKPTYNTSLSTLLMACDYGTLMSSTPGWPLIQKFGIVDIDWSNAKAEWINTAPMSCEETMVKQAAIIKQGRPERKVWIYRNTVIAYPWMATVRKIMDDPAYDVWFLRFKDGADGKGPLHHDGDGTYHSPVCDHNFDPPKCSELYHSQAQTPEHPYAQGSGGNCVGPCDCGRAPCGFYLFDQRQWNTSVNNVTLRNWIINELIVAPLLDPSVDGFFIDDSWSSSSVSDIGHTPFLDANLSTADGEAMTKAWRANEALVNDAVIEHNGFLWQMLINGGQDNYNEAGPAITNVTCAATLRASCLPDSIYQTGALFYGLAKKNWSPGYVVKDIQTHLAAFLVMRGDYAWMGFAWEGCTNATEKRFDLWRRPAAVDVDYGTPTGLCIEIRPGVFQREWTKSTALVDCNHFVGSVSLKA
jgi:hypothetical protein